MGNSKARVHSRSQELKIKGSLHPDVHPLNFNSNTNRAITATRGTLEAVEARLQRIYEAWAIQGAYDTHSAPQSRNLSSHSDL